MHRTETRLKSKREIILPNKKSFAQDVGNFFKNPSDCSPKSSVQTTEPSFAVKILSCKILISTICILHTHPNHHSNIAKQRNIFHFDCLFIE